MITFDERIKEHVPSLVVFEAARHKEENEEIERTVAPLRDEFGPRLNLIRVDGTEDQRLRDFYGIHRYPTWILFREGQELAREEGMKTTENLREMIKTAL